MGPELYHHFDPYPNQASRLSISPPKLGGTIHGAMGSRAQHLQLDDGEHRHCRGPSEIQHVWETIVMFDCYSMALHHLVWSFPVLWLWLWLWCLPLWLLWTSVHFLAAAFSFTLCVCVGGCHFRNHLSQKRGFILINDGCVSLSLSIYMYIYITLAYTYTHTFGASPANGLIPSIFRLVNDETSPSMGKNPVPGPGRSKWAQFFGAASSCYRALWHPCTCKAWFLVCGGILSHIVAKLGDENWPLEGHLRWSVLFTIFIICKVFRRYLPLFAIFTNLRTDKSLRTIWFILGCNLLIGYWGWICTYKLTIPIKSAQENGTKQGWHQWMFAVFVLISNFQLTYLMISRILCHGQPNTWRKKWGGIQTNHVNSEEHTWRIHELVHFMRHCR